MKKCQDRSDAEILEAAGQEKEQECSSPDCCGDIERRQFIKLVGVGAASMATLGCAHGAKTITASPEIDHFVPVDKNLSRRWVKSLFSKGRPKVYRGQELETIGMPCGGICAGQLDVRGDGTLAYWWIANDAYNTGYGHESVMQLKTAVGQEYKVVYQTHRPPSPIDQGFAISVQESRGRAEVRRLNRDDFDDIRFVGEYPVASIAYRSKKKPKLPVDVDAEVFSPFIPLNTRDSAIPATVLRYTIRNRSRKSVDVNLAGWLQNPVCLAFEGKNASWSRNRAMRQDGMASVHFDIAENQQDVPERREKVFEDFEDGSYARWRIEGEAFGKEPATGTLPDQNPVSGWAGKRLVNTFLGGDGPRGKLVSSPFKIEEPYIGFHIGGGEHEGRTCMNLIVDEKTVRTATGSNDERLQVASWDVRKLIGQKAHFEVVDAESGPWGHINIDRIYFTNVRPETIHGYPSGHPQFGNVSLTALDAPNTVAIAGSDSIDALLERLASQEADRSPEEVLYPLGEKQPGAVTSSFRLKRGESRTLTFLLSWYFPNRQQNEGGAGWGKQVGIGNPVGNMYANWYESSLDVATYVNRNFARLDGDTQRFRDTYYHQTTLPYWLMQRIAMPASTLATETCQWWENGRFWAFEGVGCCHGTCTHVWNYEHAVARLFPELERSTREMQDLGPALNQETGVIGHRGGTHPALDGQAGTILKAYREHQMSADPEFLERNWPKIRRALEYLIEQDGDADGLIEGRQPNTYDISFFGANTFVGSLYLAALRAGEEMAHKMGDISFAERAHQVFTKGSALSVQRLFNGEYFIQDLDRKDLPEHQYADGCLSDQLFGQGWAHQVGLGYIYPKSKVDGALKSVWRYNWAPDVAPQNRVHHPERTYADPGEAGLFICTWPKSKHLEDRAVRYRNEVWTGIEYQVASHMLYEGMVKEALAIIRAAHDRYDGTKHNPWNEIECGDHYARAMASWGCLLGAAGFRYDGPAGFIGFSPRLSPRDFESFFTGAEGWGTLAQKRRGSNQVNRIAIKWGRLRLRSVKLEIPKGRRVRQATATVADREIQSSVAQKNQEVTLEFTEELRIGVDEAVEIRMRL